jgi:hypothetical protein
MTTIEPSRSPCRPHPCSVEHADVVRSYHDLVARWEQRIEASTGGYAAELARYLEDHVRPSFKDFLLGKVR